MIPCRITDNSTAIIKPEQTYATPPRPHLELTGFASTIAVIITVLVNHVYHIYDLDQNGWHYWLVFLLTIMTIACGTNVITKKLLQHQSKAGWTNGANICSS